jgi:tRNA(Ser,Leu) C12 N-acetylase TAN1
MERWNVLVTVQPARGAMHDLLRALHLFGEFRATPFKYVCVGWVLDTATFLDTLLEAEQAGRRWTKHLARVVPLVQTFEFNPDSLQGKLEAALSGVAETIHAGTCMVRLERRGRAEQLHTAELEPMLADYLFERAGKQGEALHTSFTDPDYIVAVETLDTQCGVALITREQRQRYPFVRVH